MQIRMSRLWRLGAAIVASITVATTVSPPSAAAVTPSQVLSAISTAYEAYEKQFGGEMDIEESTTQILNAIGSVETSLIGHIDLLSSATIRACARSAVINVADIRLMTKDSLQFFAMAATDCVTKADAYITATTHKPALNEMGFAVNTVGPIALLARSKAGLTTPVLEKTLTHANNTLVKKLNPSCSAIPQPSDSPASLEVKLVCTAFNGKQGVRYVFVQRNRPLPVFDYTIPRTQAMVGASHPVGLAALAELAA
ncbi:hypothetical protein E1218_08515 [Kribbella turkmenica]|uniref:Uncharacterized protein n=1 Tax=Kribbella turkmenica TaxID=2530375 RepID=A0A4R4XBM2_9ACTN|nr:hypothetical protein [Kribbella turkmenica]TDD28071.1 hypothetical protein E1218_08515 [Kribbella turkmenica]